MKEGYDGLPQRVPETVAGRVLERAAQLDAVDARTISVEHLRAAALEAGISAGALEQALREVTAAEKVESARARPALPGRLRVPAALLGVAAALVLAVAFLARVASHPAGGWDQVIIEAPRAPAPPAPPEIIIVQPRR